MGQLTLHDAYLNAFAVFSRRVKFVEWTLFEVVDKASKTSFDVKGDAKTGVWWNPFGNYTNGRLLKTYAPIRGTRWIYAFRSFGGQPVKLANEFLLDDKGQLHATQMDAMEASYKNGLWPERGKRGAQVAVGTNVCFLRQFMGAPVQHYFFSSRVALPSKLIAELENEIVDWADAITFEPNDPNIDFSVNEQEGLIPVLDPITIATHLHAYYIAASDDLIKYVAPIDDSSGSTPGQSAGDVKKRQQKLALAVTINALLDENKDSDLSSNADWEAVYDYIDDYGHQVAFRQKWFHTWAAYLANWLSARPIAFTAEAHMFDEITDFPNFLLQMANCHHRLTHSPQGRALITRHFAEPANFKWIQKYALGRESIDKDLFQAIRKVGLAKLELVKEHVPIWLEVRNQDAPEEIRQALQTLFGDDVKFGKIQWNAKTMQYNVRKRYRFKGKGPRHLDQRATYEELQHLTAEIREGKYLHLEVRWQGMIGSIAEGIDLLNLAFKIATFPDEGSGEEQVWAAVDLIGAGFDLTTSTLSLIKKGENAMAALSFFSAVIDSVTSFRDLAHDLDKRKYREALGDTVVFIGSASTAVSILMGAEAAASFTPIGLLIVGVGFIVKFLLTSPDDNHNLVSFCEFGRGNSNGAQKPEWFTTDHTYNDWKGNLDEQLRAMVALLCKFDMVAWQSDNNVPVDASAERWLRSGLLKMGWIPFNSELALTYTESWSNPKTSRTFQASISFDDEVSVSANELEITGDDSGILVEAPSSNAPQLSTLDSPWVSANLDSIVLEGELKVPIAGSPYTVKSKATLLKHFAEINGWPKPVAIPD